MILFNNGNGELSANAAFAFFADGENVNSVLHGFNKERMGRFGRPLLD